MGLIYGKFYNEIFNIAPGEGQIRVSFTSESNSESLVFPKEYSQEEIILYGFSLGENGLVG